MLKGIGFLRLIIGAGLLAVTFFSLIIGNETIFPSALVVSLLFFLNLGKGRVYESKGQREAYAGRAAIYAINTFGLFIAAVSLLVSMFLPAAAEYYNITGLFDGDFVRVTINDVHEFSYSTCLLITINFVYLLVLNRKKALTA